MQAFSPTFLTPSRTLVVLHLSTQPPVKMSGIQPGSIMSLRRQFTNPGA